MKRSRVVEFNEKEYFEHIMNGMRLTKSQKIYLRYKFNHDHHNLHETNNYIIWINKTLNKLKQSNSFI